MFWIASLIVLSTITLVALCIGLRIRFVERADAKAEHIEAVELQRRREAESRLTDEDREFLIRHQWEPAPPVQPCEQVRTKPRGLVDIIMDELVHPECVND